MFCMSCYTINQIKIIFTKTMRNSTSLLVNQVGFIIIGYYLGFLKYTTNGSSSVSFSCLLRILGVDTNQSWKIAALPCSDFFQNLRKKKWKERDTDVCFLVSRCSTHGNGSKLHQEKFKLDIWKHFYMEWVIKDWNRLPRAVINGWSVPQACQCSRANGQCPQ